MKHRIIKIRYLLTLNALLFATHLLSAQMPTTLNLPNGFEISVLSSGLDSPRQITETNKGHIIVGSKKGSEVTALLNKNNGTYDQVVVANGMENPAGVAVYNGDLYIAEMDTIWVIKNIDLWIDSASKTLPEKNIYMNNLPSETWHGLKYIDFGPDGNLYIPVGVPCNICLEPQTVDPRFAAIHKYVDGELITVADGVRNSVGFDWHPVTNKMYFSDNGRDWLGDNTPSCELNVIDKEGAFFGYPFKHATNVIDPEFGHMIPEVKKDFVDPIAELGPHVAPLGVAFYDGDLFPEKYQNSIFVALHGSWNKYNGKSGYKVVFVQLDEEGNYVNQEDFISGWLKNEEAWGRPAAPFVMSDGSLLISDDKYNVIYRVTYKG
ncbi:MAG: PQQ-dependent sugar dehydrogenase [Gammaproteobacteria bacterium]